MIYLKNKMFFFSLFSLILFSSCFGELGTSKEDFGYPEYKSDILWELKTNFTDEYPNFYQEDNYLYCGEKISEYEEYGFLSKINLNDGTYVWKSEEFSFLGLRTAPLSVGDYVFVQAKGEDNDICMYVFEKYSGEILATVQLWNNDDDKKNLSSIKRMISWNNKIYWAGHGVFMFNIEKINFSVSPNERQIIIPECIWKDNVYYLNILMRPVCSYGILYFMTYDYEGYHYEISSQSRLLAYDLENRKELWSYNCKRLYGYGLENMIIVDDKLYVIEQGLGCFDLKTGKCYHESFQTKKDLMKMDFLAGSIYSDGITYHDGKFFYTNTSSWGSAAQTGIPQKNIHNIICLDSKTFKMVWGQLPKGSGSQTACPTVLNGKVLVPLWLGGLYVLDEKTGDILGVDSSIVSLGSAQSFTYNGVAYFMDYSNARNSGTEKVTRLVAVRP